MSKNDGEIVIGTKVDDSGFSSGISKLGGTAAKAMAVVTAAIGAASIAIISLGSEFETANAKASTLFGDANVNMSQYSTDMLALSTKTGLAASELGNTMYDALSAGIPASDDMSEAMGFLEKNTKLAKAGFTDINTATTATAKVLNAYKMDVSETDRVHKILMQTQNAGITTVGELGSVLSQVTPTASAMSVSFEQVGAALANMTAQGTPTAQATTQLNQLLAELGKSGTKANDSMMAATQGTAHAGKSFQDLMKEGVPLNEILDLIDQSAQDNGLSMLDMFSSIESGKAALSISGQNSKQFAKNLDAMGTSADVVGEAYEKVTNTFEEKSKKAVNSLKNVGIAAYDKFKEPLTKSMDAAQKAIDGLSKDMASGKLGKSVDKIADAFGTLIQVAIDIASKAIPLLINGFSLVVDNGELVAVAISAIGAGMLAMKAMDFVNGVIAPLAKGFQTAQLSLHLFEMSNTSASLAQAALNGTLGASEIVVSLITGKITLATAAQAAWNAITAISPMGMLAIGIGATVAALGTLTLFLGDNSSAAESHAKHIKESTKAYQELEDTKNESLKNSLNEISRYQQLKEELDYLVDANGRVKEGYELRAEYIANELNEAFGLEMKIVDGMIDKYGEASEQMTSYIDKMRATAIVEAQATTMKEIEKIYTDNNIKMAEIDAQMATARSENDTYTLTALQIQKDNLSALQGGILTDRATFYNNQELLANGSLESLREIQTTELSQYDEQGKRIDSSLEERAMREISNIQTLQTAVENTTNEGHKKQLLREQGMSIEKLDNLQKELKSQVSAVGQATPEQQQAYTLLSVARLNALKSQSDEYFGISEKEMDDLLVGLNSKSSVIRTASEHKAQIMLDGLKSKDDEYSKAGANVISGITGGVDGSSKGFYTTMSGIASNALTSFKNALGIKSPSRAFAALSKYIPEGISKGVNENAETAINSVENLSEKMTDSFDATSIFEKMDPAKIDEIVANAQNAVNSNHLIFEKKAKINAEYEVGKAVLQFQNQEIKVTGTLKANIENHINIDGRETAIALTPFVAEELGFE